jgi:hypothetical protein
MKNKDEITIYWSPAAYVADKESWALAYAEPVSLINEYRQNKNLQNGSNNFFACPAVSDMFKNIYVVRQQFDDKIIISDIDRHFEDNEKINGGSLLSSFTPRKSSLNNYFNIQYNMCWTFFADEPVVARFTSPYFPPHSPAKGALLMCGEFDIGSWYRTFNLDYHIPLDTKEMVFNQNDPLFYIEFKTDKKVILKRYMQSDTLFNIGREMVNSPSNYGRFKSLKEKYLMSKKAKMPEIILSEINKNLID